MCFGSDLRRWVYLLVTRCLFPRFPNDFGCVCVCVCVRARADHANNQASVHDGKHAEAHGRRFGATLWVFGHINEHALPSNFWWGDLGRSCRVPPLCWSRVDMCIYILCGLLLFLGSRINYSCLVFFCASRRVVSMIAVDLDMFLKRCDHVRPHLDVLAARASRRLVVRILGVCVCSRNKSSF